MLQLQMTSADGNAGLLLSKQQLVNLQDLLLAGLPTH
jgi:hypothetical protein